MCVQAFVAHLFSSSGDRSRRSDGGAAATPSPYPTGASRGQSWRGKRREGSVCAGVVVMVDGDREGGQRGKHAWLRVRASLAFIVFGWLGVDDDINSRSMRRGRCTGWGTNGDGGEWRPCGDGTRGGRRVEHGRSHGDCRRCGSPRESRRRACVCGTGEPGVWNWCGRVTQGERACRCWVVDEE